MHLAVATRATVAALVMCAPVVFAQQPVPAEAPVPTASAPSDQVKESPKQTPQQAVAATSIGTIESLMSKLPNGDIGKSAIDVIREITKKTRADQSSIYLFVRTVNRNIDELGGNEEGRKFAQDVRKLTKRLMLASYRDSLYQNGNLSDQIKNRAPLLIADSVKLNLPSAEYLRQDFLLELEVFTNRFLDAKRFGAGVGFQYLYLPVMSYPTAAAVDLSPFQTLDNFGSSGRTTFIVDFSNVSSPAVVVTAKVPYGQVDVAFPSETVSPAITTSVTRIAMSRNSASPDLLVRTTLESKLKLEFDLGGILWIGEGYDRLKRGDGDQVVARRWDIGLGYGTTGFQIDEKFSTDVRVRSDPAKTYNELASSGVIVTSTRRSFHVPSYRTQVKLVVSDELHLDLVYRRFRRTTIDTGPININGFSIGLTATWYPTFF
jgi:hypothetical protein